MLSTDDILLVDESNEGFANKLERWREHNRRDHMRAALKPSILSASSTTRGATTTFRLPLDLKTDLKMIISSTLGQLFRTTGNRQEHHESYQGRMAKWRNASRVLCDKRVPLISKGKL